MAKVKIENKIVGYRVSTQENLKFNETKEQITQEEPNVVRMHERLERPEMLRGTTYKIKPTKTGGNAIKELKKTFIIFFPTKLLVATKAEIGRPSIIEKKRAMVETLSDKKIIS